MKLRNKKTGEIAELGYISSSDDYIILLDVNTLEFICKYSSLAELNAEWEDVSEEPKEYWYIDDAGVIQIDQVLSSLINMRKSIGNYFDTQEDAEKAVRKLNAWKRLKDKGFRFDPVDRYEALCGNGFNIPITATMPPEAYTDAEVSKDLDICFGGEE